MNKKNMIFIISRQIFALFIISMVPIQAARMVTFSPHHVEVSISSTSMNRLAVENDRISQIFGDEGSYVSQYDEHTGQIFIKPAAENGLKPLTLSLVTENGVTQDLILKPISKTSESIIFKNNTAVSQKGRSFQTTSHYLGPNAYQEDQSFDFNHDDNSSYQTQIISFLKQVVLNQAKPIDENPVSRQSPTGYTLTYQKSYHSKGFIADCYVVANNTSTDIEIQEKVFYQQGDLALSFTNRLLKPKSSTLFYVVRVGV